MTLEQAITSIKAALSVRDKKKEESWKKYNDSVERREDLSREAGRHLLRSADMDEDFVKDVRQILDQLPR